MAQESSNRRPRPRIETLSDLVFGVSIGIGALALIGQSPSNPAGINGDIVAFVFSFFILITAWVVYTSIMSVLPVETPTVTIVNSVLLLLVALVPYLLNTVFFASPSVTTAETISPKEYASTLFALDLAGILAILATFSHILAIEERKLLSPELIGTYRTNRNFQFVLSGIVLLTIAPQFWTTTLFGYPLRLYVWYLPLVVYWSRRISRGTLI